MTIDLKCVSMLIALVVALHLNREVEARRGDQLVNMTPEELFEIVDCVAGSRNRQIQRRMNNCNAIQPYQAVAALEECSAKYASSDIRQFWRILDAQPIRTRLIFECVRQITTEYTPEETDQMLQFEACARRLYSRVCENSMDIPIALKPLGHQRYYSSF